MKRQQKRLRSEKNRITKQKDNQKSIGKRDHDFTAPDTNPTIVEEGMKAEQRAVLIKTIFFSGTFLSGALLTIFDFRDEGMLFEGFGFKFAGTLVGVLICILSIVGMWCNKTKITITGR